MKRFAVLLLASAAAFAASAQDPKIVGKLTEVQGLVTVSTGDQLINASEGTPALEGSRIITTVLQVILNVIDHQMNIAEAVAAPRVHHQWLPDIVFTERGLSPDTLRLLEARGHKIITSATSGSANSILVTPEAFTGAADPRQRGTLADGF